MSQLYPAKKTTNHGKEPLQECDGSARFDGRRRHVGTAFITSGTSVIGYRVAQGLLQEAGLQSCSRGHLWKGLRQKGIDASIGQEVLDELEALGATIIAFDWTNHDQYVMALSGVTPVFCTLPHIAASVNTFSAFVNACHKANVKHFVKASFYRVTSDASSDAYATAVPRIKFQRPCDEALAKKHHPMDSRMMHMLLCASHLLFAPLVHQGSTILRDEHKYITASYDMDVNYVSPNDVSSAGVVALVNRKKHRNKNYNLTGPGPINDRDVCKLLSEFVGQESEHVKMGFHEFEAALTSREFPDWLVKDLALVEKASGIEEGKSSYSSDMETVIGRKPQQYKDYLDSKDDMTCQEKVAIKKSDP